MVNIKNIQVDSAKGHIFDKNCPENKENILKLEYFVKLDEHCGKTMVPTFYCAVDRVEENIIKTMKNVLSKTVITSEDVKLFLENHYLIYSEDVKTKCSNYKGLKTYFNSRVKQF